MENASSWLTHCKRVAARASVWARWGFASRESASPCPSRYVISFHDFTIMAPRRRHHTHIPMMHCEKTTRMQLLANELVPKTDQHNAKSTIGRYHFASLPGLGFYVAAFAAVLSAASFSGWIAIAIDPRQHSMVQHKFMHARKLIGMRYEYFFNACRFWPAPHNRPSQKSAFDVMNSLRVKCMYECVCVFLSNQKNDCSISIGSSGWCICYAGLIRHTCWAAKKSVLFRRQKQCCSVGDVWSTE